MATKSPTKKASTKKVSTHPTYIVMVSKAIVALKDRGGSSKQKILSFIMANFKVGTDARAVNNFLKMALRRGVKAGKLQQTKGTGASGRFKVAEKAKKTKKSPSKKAKKPKKTAAATKSPKKRTKKATPKKPKAAKKPKSPKKAKSPKKKSTKKSPKKASK